MIRAVTFDVGGTLIAPFPSVGHIYAEVAAANGVPGLVASDLDTRFAEAWKRYRPGRYAKSEWAALVDATFAGLTAEPPSRTFFEELYARFTRTDCWRIFDDVIPTLVALRTRGLRLGIVSNWDASPVCSRSSRAVCRRHRSRRRRSAGRRETGVRGSSINREWGTGPNRDFRRRRRPGSFPRRKVHGR